MVCLLSSSTSSHHKTFHKQGFSTYTWRPSLSNFIWQLTINIDNAKTKMHNVNYYTLYCDCQWIKIENVLILYTQVLRLERGRLLKINNQGKSQPLHCMLKDREVSVLQTEAWPCQIGKEWGALVCTKCHATQLSWGLGSNVVCLCKSQLTLTLYTENTQRILGKNWS
jgi:hypothetical protein